MCSSRLVEKIFTIIQWCEWAGRHSGCLTRSETGQKLRSYPAFFALLAGLDMATFVCYWGRVRTLRRGFMFLNVFSIGSPIRV